MARGDEKYGDGRLSTFPNAVMVSGPNPALILLGVLDWFPLLTRSILVPFGVERVEQKLVLKKVYSALIPGLSCPATGEGIFCRVDLTVGS